MEKLIPASAIIPTYDRPDSLRATLDSLAKQNVQFFEVIIVDASADATTETLIREGIVGLKSNLVYQTANEKGAASQRNEGVAMASQPFIAFMDDDIILEPLCVDRLWKCFEINPLTLGVNAMITNQKYLPIGRFTRLMCALLEKKKYKSYAGKCIGPAWNFLPSDDESLPEYVEVDWLNTTCTMYKKAALPAPPFPDYFHGYSIMEDLTLSLTVGRYGKLLNARTARVFHDSQPGRHKSDYQELQKMELINRFYIVTKVMPGNPYRDRLGLLAFEIFQLLALFSNRSQWKNIALFIIGKIKGISELVRFR